DIVGVMSAAQNSGGRQKLNGATSAIATTVNGAGAATVDPNEGFGVSIKEQIKAADTAEVSGRANVQEAIRELAESTGGFLIAESNDMRAPMRRINQEIGSYHDLTCTTAITTYHRS